MIKGNEIAQERGLKVPFFVMGFAICFMLFFTIGVASATDYYVAMGGNNADTGLSTDHAWATPSYAARQAQAGDTIYLVDGTWYNEHVVFANSGTEGNPITMTAYNGPPTLDGQDCSGSGGIGVKIGSGIGENRRSYINVSGLTIKNYCYGFYVRGGSDIHISDCDIGTIWLQGIEASDIDHVYIDNCNVHDTGNNAIMLGTIARDTSYVSITNNKIHDNPGNSGRSGHNMVDFMANNGYTISHIDVIGNEMYNGGMGALYEHGSTYPIPMSFIKFNNNIVYDLAGEVRLSNLENSEAISNTIFNCGRGIITVEYSPSVTIKNNIIANTTSIGLWNAGGSSVWYLSYNNVWGCNPNYQNLNPGTGDISIDPLFVDVANNDIHLKSQYGRWDGLTWVIDSVDSPCINAGDPNDDCSNEPEPNGGRINMGTYGNTEEASKSTGVATGTISGTVTNKTSGSPIKGARVDAGTWYDITNETGKYTISNIPVGTYTVTASADGFESASNSSTVTAGDITTVNFELNPVDVTPSPTTTYTITPAPDEAGWNNATPVVVTFFRSDTGGSGISHTNHSKVSATGPWTTVNTATAIGPDAENVTDISEGKFNLTVSNEGVTTIWYYSVDVNSNVEATKNVTVKIDTIPPNITNVHATSVTTDGATTTWNTDEAADTKVTYDKNPSNLGAVWQNSSELTTSHSITLTELDENTAYFFKVYSTDITGNTANSTIHNFTTSSGLPGNDTAIIQAQSDVNDNRLRSSTPDAVLNDTVWIDVGRLSPDIDYRGLIWFDLSMFNSTDKINKATLSLFWYYESRNKSTTVEIYRPSDWDENYVNWNNRTSGVAWNNPGGDWYDRTNMAQGNTPYASLAFPIGAPDNVYHDFDVTDLVQSYVISTYDNAGFFIKANEVDDSYIAFRSSDYENASQRPKLIISYNGGSPSEDTTPPSTIFNLQNTTGTTWINWTWTNPAEEDFGHTMIYLNGVWKTNTSDAYYNATDLAPDTTYEISTRTVDTNGNVNTNWVNQTATTLAVPNSPPVSDPNGPYTSTEGVPVTFDGSASYDPDGSIVVYEWDFGDGNTATGVNPTHIYAQNGTYTATLIVTDDDGATDTNTTTATIADTKPTADFSATPVSGPEPLTVTFTDGSTSYDGITAWEWDFNNDGVTDSTAQNPTYLYAEDGVYTVTLTVYEADGDSDTMTKPDYITVTDEASPTITDHSPEGASVPIATTITATFSEAMNKASTENAFSISPSVSGSLSWDANKMIFTPDSELEYETTYTVTIGIGAEDLTGNNLESPFSWLFTTLTPDIGLVGEWEFNEGTGDIVVDSSGNGNNGTLINDPVWVAGKMGKGLEFDGSTNYIEVASSSSLNSITSQITILAWIKTDFAQRGAIVDNWFYDKTVDPALGERAYVCSALSGSDAGKFNFGLSPQGNGSGSVWLTSNTAVTPTQWTHVAFVSDCSTMAIYLNGELDASTSAPAQIYQSLRPIHIGAWNAKEVGYPPFDTFFNGTVDEVKIYNKALSSAEIHADYEAAGLDDTTPPSAISNLQNTTGTTWINWTWTNPADDDFSHTIIYVNGIWKASTSDAYYNATGLSADTTYELSTCTVDTHGNVNNIWVNQTATTLAVPNGAVSGAITSTNDGTGVSGVTVNLTLNSTGTVIASTTTDSNGDYTFTNVSPGEYTLTASKIRFWSDSMSVTVNSTVTANCALWLKGDLNNNGISADAGDRAMMKDASVGKITADWRYDLNTNGIFADSGDRAMMKDACVGKIELL